MGKTISGIKKIVTVFTGFVLLLLIAPKAEALEPRLLWEKKFKYTIDSVYLATETGQVILSLDKREIILFDKDGNERFHWGPRIDRAVGGAQISKDGKYFAFYSGYAWQFFVRRTLLDCKK